MKTNNKLTKALIPALALGFATISFAPTDIQAKPKHVKHYEKARKHHRKAVKHYYKSSYRPYRSHYYSPYHYKAPKRKHESLQIFSTPGGGIGFSYHESKGRYPGWY